MIKIKCDECKEEFFLNTVNIDEAIVELNGTLVTLVYFTCPKCNKIYRVSIQDRRYYELKEDLEKSKKKIRKNYGSNDVETMRILNSMIVRKHERLKAHVSKVNKMFQGTFVFEASENNQEKNKIVYLP